MLYRNYKNLKLSLLSFGAMRLPLVDNDDAIIDEDTTAKMIETAMQAGINYYDTAWGYHGGNSEKIMGRLLGAYPRDSYYLADKFPGYDLSNIDKVESIFEEQLKRCGVDYFDFYLFHNVCEVNIDAYLDKSHGILAYLLKQKESGRVRSLGFSVHGSYEVMQRFLEAYADFMEFGQIQLNYLDWTFQQGKEKVALLKEYALPVWVMEPVRGGSLAALSKEDTAKLKILRPDEGVPAWAFRFLANIPEATTILSGMSNLEQLQENIKTFEEGLPLTLEERSVLLDIAQGMEQEFSVPCTSCRYCVSYCPQELDIPYLLKLYSEHRSKEGGFLAPMALQTLADNKKPHACTGCQSCEAVCPQQIKISEAMADFAQRLG